VGQLEDIDARLAAVEAAVRERETPGRWLDVNGAAEYLSMTPKAVRHAINGGAATKDGPPKYAPLPVHRTPTNRLRLHTTEVDQWVVFGDRIES
jgi:hypothetical protein